MTDHEQIAISDELLFVMRTAASGAFAAGEKFISPRRILISLLQDPALSETFKNIVDADALSAAAPDSDEVPAPAAAPEDRLPETESPALVRYNTLAFKDATGSNSVWLDGAAHAVFVEGARRAKNHYLPKDLLLGFVSEWRRAPQVLHDIKIDGTKFAQAAFALPEAPAAT